MQNYKEAWWCILSYIYEKGMEGIQLGETYDIVEVDEGWEGNQHTTMDKSLLSLRFGF